MKTVLATLLTLLSVAHATAEECPVPTGFITKTTTVDGVTRRHAVYVPADYTPERAWPLVVFLHGAGERGEDGIFQTEVGIGTAIRRNADRFPAIVVFPQCPKDKFWDSMLPELDAIMAQAEADYTIDSQRRYLTGISMGGYGCWTWGADHADQFAAILPICGGGNPEDLSRITATPVDSSKFGSLKERVQKLTTVPIWAFHGLKDMTVPPIRTKQMVRMVTREGGKIQHGEYEREGHDVWNAVYGDEKIMAWMFEQKRE